MKRFLQLLVLLIIVTGVGLAIYATRHKTSDNTTDLSQVLGGNATNQTQTPQTPETQTPQTQVPTTSTPPETSTPVVHPPVAVAAATTKTYYIPALRLNITVPVSWYEFSGASDASNIVFMSADQRVYYGSIDVFVGTQETLGQLQSDLQNDPAIYNLQNGTYMGLPALTFYKSGEPGLITAFIYGNNVYYLKGQVRDSAVLKFK